MAERKGRCGMCDVPCDIECGKCFAVLQTYGQKHKCPDSDEGFYEVYEGSLLLCSVCKSSPSDQHGVETSRTPQLRALQEAFKQLWLVATANET